MRAGLIKNSYSQIGTKASISESSPEQITLLLLQRAYSSIHGCILSIETLNSEAANWENRIPVVENYHKNVSKALQILTALREYLDYENGGSLAEQLATTYNAILSGLFKASQQKNAGELTKLLNAVGELKDAWSVVVEQSPHKELA